MGNSETQLTWQRSSGCVGGDCAEVAALPGGGVTMRNSHDPSVSLRYTRAEWAAFMDGVRAGEFDDLLD